MYEKYPVVLATAAFITNRQGQLLIVRKSLLEQIDAGLWTIPGGKVFPHEPIVASLKREVAEEVGLDIATYEWIGEDVFVSKDRYFHAQHFLCTIKPGTPVILEKKLLEYAWIGENKVSEYAFPENIKNRILSIFSNPQWIKK